MDKRYFLGVDGGGSKTTAVIFDGNGVFVAGAVGESINYYSVGLSAARENMLSVITSLSAETGINHFDCAVIGMSALSSRASATQAEAFAGGIIAADKVVMDSDVFVALTALAPQGECAVVISGTGSMVAARCESGEITTCGGWGYILGDEGSGYAIALGAIKAAIAAAESGSQTALVGECLAYFGIKDLYELIDLYYAKGVSRKQTAAFAPRVCACAAGGDRCAQEVIKRQAKLLYKTAMHRISSLKKPAPIGLWGGIFQHNELFRNEFVALLCGNGYANVKLLDFTPEVGAVIACYEENGINIDSKTISNLKSTYSSGMCKAI